MSEENDVYYMAGTIEKHRSGEMGLRQSGEPSTDLAEVEKAAVRMAQFCKGTKVYIFKTVKYGVVEAPVKWTSTELESN